MATLVLQAAGAAVGSVFGPIGTIIGQAAGALAGSMIDKQLFGTQRSVNGAQLANARIGGADEGEAITRVYGTARVGGTLIWATRFQESVTVERSGGKGGGGGSSQTVVTTYQYHGNFAFGICEGEIAAVRRIWADGQLLDQSRFGLRIYNGSHDQMPDPLISARQGSGNVPAYRGLSYAVFENFPLEAYGNRIPLMQFEVVRPIGTLQKQIRAVTMIPGAGEHVYATSPVSEESGFGQMRYLNRHLAGTYSDWQASLDELQALCPNLEKVALVVSWFGTDMRAGECQILPGVEVRSRDQESMTWSVAGYSRANAHLVSQRAGGPAYGGTPSDESVLQAIADLKARGIKASLYPFIMMDVPQGNDLPDPYGKGQQDAYGWRGDITVTPAIGQDNSADRSDRARAQIATFLNRTDGYKRMVLHYAQLAALAGGIDLLLIGSELRGLTRIRDDEGAFPFVEGLIEIAGAARAIVGSSTKLTYGADWSEYFGYHPQDGSGDIFFNLDPLWANEAINAVGIDNYMPLSDWRDEDLINGNPDGFTHADDMLAMRAMIGAGEGYDWYYQDDEARRLRQRTAIRDGADGKDWIYRVKDIGAWWANAHYERIGGVEKAVPSPWVPNSKPIILTEVGCGAVDKGAARPSAFLDPKSAVSALPPFSSGVRSDSQQRAFLEAHLSHWASSGLIDPSNVFIWTWDARPYPIFPSRTDIWSDGSNWATGHWLNGRLGASGLGATIAAILSEHGFDHYDVSAVSGGLDGYVQASVTSARALLEPLLRVFQIDVVEQNGWLKFLPRGNFASPAQTVTELADIEGEPLWRERRGHESDFSSEIVLSTFDPNNAYEKSSVRSRRIDGPNERVTRIDLPAVISQQEAQNLAENLLRDERMARRSIQFSLPQQDVRLMPGDCVELEEGPKGRFQVTRVEEGLYRRIEAREFLSALNVLRSGADTPTRSDEDGAYGFDPVIMMMDLPRYKDGADEDFAVVAAFAKPWRRIGGASSTGDDGYQPRVLIERPAKIGILQKPLFKGPRATIDFANCIEARFAFGDLQSVSIEALMAGANRAAIESQDGGYEVLGFANAREVESGLWQLTGLLRALGASDGPMMSGAESGAKIVLLDSAVQPLGLQASERAMPLNWLFAPISDVNAKKGPFSFQGGKCAQTPLSPVHLSVERLGADLKIGWVRRSRIDGDDFEAVEIGLDEPFEGYLLEIISDGLVLHAQEVERSPYVYDAAQQATDGLSAGQIIEIRLRQKGRIIALGAPQTISFRI